MIILKRINKFILKITNQIFSIKDNILLVFLIRVRRIFMHYTNSSHSNYNKHYPPRAVTTLSKTVRD